MIVKNQKVEWEVQQMWVRWEVRDATGILVGYAPDEEGCKKIEAIVKSWHPTHLEFPFEYFLGSVDEEIEE